jgi:hypothetical protein
MELGVQHHDLAAVPYGYPTLHTHGQEAGWNPNPALARIRAQVFQPVPRLYTD